MSFIDHLFGTRDHGQARSREAFPGADTTGAAEVDRLVDVPPRTGHEAQPIMSERSRIVTEAASVTLSHMTPGDWETWFNIPSAPPAIVEAQPVPLAMSAELEQVSEAHSFAQDELAYAEATEVPNVHAGMTGSDDQFLTDAGIDPMSEYTIPAEQRFVPQDVIEADASVGTMSTDEEYMIDLWNAERQMQAEQSARANLEQIQAEIAAQKAAA